MSNLTGKKFKLNTIGFATVICDNGGSRVVVELSQGQVITVQRSNLKRGLIKDRMIPSVCGVGFLGVGEFETSRNGKSNKCYSTWIDMMKRCYSDLRLKAFPTYVGCSVCSEWHNFQNFAKWFYKNYEEGMELDKDVTIDGNKEYSPVACKFITKKDNVEKASAKNYKFLSPNGEIVEIYNLRQFCIKNKLSPPNMHKVKNGERESHKGWRKA